jgi:rod shape-determining protein MreD
VRKAWLAPVVILVGIVVQLTVLNGLRLPGGGVPDLVLVLVVALAITEGPMAGVIIGFAAGLCLDIAPPGSELLGQYALVFCLAGWAAGRLSSAAGRSAVRALAIAAAVIAVAEALAAGVGLALEPAAVTTAAVREVLPTTIGYDLLLCPFVLYLIVLATALLSDGIASSGLAGVLATPTRSERAAERSAASCSSRGSAAPPSGLATAGSAAARGCPTAPATRIRRTALACGSVRRMAWPDRRPALSALPAAPCIPR